jgi:serine/threonine-protein kinase
MPIVTGTRLGRYEIRSQLGAGGMGEVYLARDTTELERTVAIKVLPPDVASDVERLRRFIQEAKTASSLNHPNILTIYEIGVADSSRFIATEYVEGETLRQRISRSLRLSLRESLDIAIQIASALVAAHRAGVVHRDIKPENVMVREDGIVKVLDFGLAKSIVRPAGQLEVDTEAVTRAQVKTNPGVIFGTFAYMSPEQARGLTLDARTDIWSLGVVLYEMVGGRAPFAAETASDVIGRILWKEPQALASVSSEATEQLDEIVQKALVKDREERYQHVKDLLIDLKRLRRRLDVEAEIERSVQPAVENAGAATTSSGQFDRETAHTSVVTSSDVAEVHPTSRAEQFARGIKQHTRGVIVALAVLLAVGVGLIYLYFARPSNKTIDSIAVLPFANAGGDPEMEYLSDGISESLINSLSQLTGLKIMSRNSVFRYKGQEVDARAVGNTLSVQAVLTGRVVQHGDDLSISVELVDARDSSHLWGGQYNRKATDLLRVQSEISREIAETLRLRLTAGERQQLAKREAVNPQAYELLLKGRFYWNKGGTENGKKAVEYYQQAIAVDPAYALAYAELSLGYDLLVGNSILDPKEFRPRAEVAAYKALALDDDIAEAHLALAIIKLSAWEWAAAEREFKRAIELNPNLARARGTYALYLSLQGRHEQAIAERKRARELDPLSPIVNFGVGYSLLLARQNDQAIEAANRTLELDPNYPGAHNLLGYAYAAKGQYQEAIAAYQEGIRLGADSPDIQIELGAAYAKGGEREKARVILKRLEASKGYVSPVGLARLYVAFGELEQALASLERAYAMHDDQLEFLHVDPNLDPLRSDPRFQDLVRRVGLPQ